MRSRQIVLACCISAAFALAACGSSQSSNPPISTGQSASPEPAVGSRQHRAVLALIGQPELTADGKNIVVAMNVTNDGTATFGSATEPDNVNLGAHAIDAAGKIVVNDLARGRLPQIAPGATEEASILLPVGETLGRSVQLLPVQEHVGWFDVWGTKPLVVGPFQNCKDAMTGKVCDASGKALPSQTAGHP